MPVVEQLGYLLTVYAKTVTDLLRDWDEDGNGGIDKREFRRALIALGYNAPKAVHHDLFDSLDCIRKARCHLPRLPTVAPCNPPPSSPLAHALL